MSLDQTYPLQRPGLAWSPWLLVAAGMAAMYIPSFADLFRGAWGTERNAHGPIVLVVACCYFYVRLKQLHAEGLIERRPAPLAAGCMLLLALLCFALGRSQTVLFLEAGSLIPLLAGIVLLLFGVNTCRRLWFAFFFMLFMVPLPASVVDFLTQPLKVGVSYASEHLLYAMGYPIARNGVILAIGPYQLLVADACAGLNSLFTLEALGLLYMNLVRHQSLLRNTVLALLIVPISFTANTVRVVVLALITFYLGDAAGQGFLHGFAGMLLFLVALGLIMALDNLLRWIAARYALWRGLPPPERIVGQRSAGPGRMRALFAMPPRPAALLMLGMLLSVLAAHLLAPHQLSSVKPDKFDSFMPAQFGDWREVPSPFLQVSLSVDDPTERDTDRPYDDVASRTYVNSRGEQVMLALAYAREQMQDVKIHLPERCYAAQGFQLIERSKASFDAGDGRSAAGHVFLARNKGRLEAVSYWVRIGDSFPDGGLAARARIFEDGLAGKISDGILVRASSLVGEPAQAGAAYALQQAFLRDFAQSLRVSHPGLLTPA
jgi:exosortase B